ncbi:MAG TPA: class I SAM-dependent methyltransferase [Gemmatimonadaceae bacterium]
MDTTDVRRIYDRIAPRYDLLVALSEWLVLRRLRRPHVRRARGRVLEVAIGTGANLPHYDRGVRLTAVDASPAMLGRARRRSVALATAADLVAADAQLLPFPAQTFDAVVSTLSVCTFPDPVAALREISRVCRPDGRIFLLEHGRSDRRWVGRWQDRGEARSVAMMGCHPNREPLELARAAGLGIVAARRHLLGIVHVIEAAPAPGAPTGAARGDEGRNALAAPLPAWPTDYL